MQEVFDKEFIKSLERLTKDQQEKALAYVKNLLHKETNQQRLLQFVGSIDAKSIDEMSKAIEADCEKIERDEW